MGFTNSDRIKLLPHNEEAFVKLKKSLESNQLVSINHATGTGKSFIVLKYLYENKDKRILFLSPSYPINDQLIQEHMKELGINIKEFNKIDTLIYRNLLKMNMNELASNYDIIILDEYHRCGAKKWGIKVNELLSLVKEKYHDTKVVGTTATEIRYLDNEKNMNNILFDGVCASTLTLADAMLKGILPVPVYINSLIELSSEYENIISKIYKKTLYDRERDYYFNLVSGIRNKIDNIVACEEDINKYIKKDGKNLVFSSTIDNIAKDKISINKLLGCRHNEYIVHSRRTKEDNFKALKDFRYDDKPSTLYCVNILNEGVHVKGVDSIFMLRPTTSPIIFFQQLGRLLSYSRRKDKVFVFDLVNNVRNSPYIYKLYIDLYQRTEELIKTDPDNIDKYLNIVSRFKIVDATSKIYDKFDILKTALLKENFYKKRIDFAIEILQENNPNIIEEKMANLDLFKYYKYITLDQFKIIKELDVHKPSIFNLTENQFIDMLSGEENIFVKEKKLSMIIINKVNDFCETNGYFPSILGQNMEECSIARDFINIHDREELDASIFNDKNIDKLTEYEKIIYGLSTNIDLETLYDEIDELITKKYNISLYVLNIIKNQNTEMARKYIDKLLKYNANKEQNKINSDDMLSEETFSNKGADLKLLYKQDYDKVAKKCMLEIKSYDSIDEYLKRFSEEFVDFINENKRMPIYYLQGVADDELEQMRTLYIKKMIFYDELNSLGYIDLFDEVYNSVQLELLKTNKEMILKKIIDFLNEHNGDMPSLKLADDRKLALQFNRIKNILDDNDINSINLYKSDDRTKSVVLRYIKFVKENKRYPLINADDEEEKQLLDDYIRNELYFSENDKKMISDLKKVVSQRKAMQNAYAELLKQKKRR